MIDPQVFRFASPSARNRLTVLRKKTLTFLLAAIAATTIAACAENLDAGKSCPLLCPQQAILLADTTIFGVEIDSTVIGLPPIGHEAYLMLASHGDTLETRAIVRFDTLPQSYTKSTIDSVITHLDSAILITPIAKPDSLHRLKAPVTIEAYNVDTVDTDTSAVILGSLFRPDRFLGSKTFAPESLLDTLRIPISTDSVYDRVKNGTRLRVGFRVRSSIGVDIRIGTSQTNGPVSLRLRASLDTAAAPVSVAPNSSTPPAQTFASGPLEDFTIVLKGGQTTLGANALGVGGVPSRRTYIRFNIPSHIVDSTTIVRASLLLTSFQIGASIRTIRYTFNRWQSFHRRWSTILRRRSSSCRRLVRSASTRSSPLRPTAASARSSSLGSFAHGAGKRQPKAPGPSR